MGGTVWLTIEEVAERIRVRPRTLYSWRSAGTGPPGYRVGKRILWKLDEVDAWMSREAAQAAPA
jgi:excisionase family DNA binding protein